jgi:predicted kinase
VTKTRLIIVSGASASGKTKLSEFLRDELHVPLISKDVIKETLMDVWPPANREESTRIGEGTWPVLYATLDLLVGYVPGLIAEANFQTGYSEPSFRPLIEKSDTTLIYCFADKQTTIDRIKAREDDPDRHEGHFDQDALPILDDLIDKDAYRLDLPGVTRIDVDTTNDYHPSLPEILEQIRQN